MKPTVFIDADACPVTADALAVARACKVPVVIAGNSTQNLARHIRRGDPRTPTDGFWVDTLAVGVGADAADFAIVQELSRGDRGRVASRRRVSPQCTISMFSQ